MIVYRLAKTKYVHDLTGYGAYLYGGRWNEMGIHTLYCSTQRPLALLELLVHRNGCHLTLEQFTMIELEVKEADIVDMYAESLDLLQQGKVLEQSQLARKAFASADVAGVRVASAILPQESNILLNPKSSAHAAIKIMDEYVLSIDPRLVR